MHVLMGICCNLKYFHKGDDFGKEYSKLGEVRSILSTLTATATKTLGGGVIKVLGMKSQVVVTVNPDNIKYKLVPFVSMNKTFGGALTD